MAVGTPPFEGTKEERRAARAEGGAALPRVAVAGAGRAAEGAAEEEPLGAAGRRRRRRGRGEEHAVLLDGGLAGARREGGGVQQRRAAGHPVPRPPGRAEGEKRGQKGVDEDELLGFEYDEPGGAGTLYNAERLHRDGQLRDGLTGLLLFFSMCCLLSHPRASMGILFFGGFLVVLTVRGHGKPTNPV